MQILAENRQIRTHHELLQQKILYQQNLGRLQKQQSNLLHHLPKTIHRANQKHSYGHHFNQENHNGINDVTIHIVEFIHMHPESMGSIDLRRSIERNWQHKLHTIAPQGLNIQE